VVIALGTNLLIVFYSFAPDDLAAMLALQPQSLRANAPLAFFPDPAAPSNLVSVRRGDVVFICVRGTGVLVQPSG